jgi:flavin reductase (DIM6/NTAB) family NADH-FMN oxidoreductase RutF
VFFATADGMRPAPLRHNPLNALVSPRPIAWVSTVDARGAPNLAPYSYFNAVSADPPYVMFAPNAKAPGQPKDTWANLRAVPEFVVSLVTERAATAMNATSAPFEAGVDEFAACGVAPAPCRLVRPPRVADAPAALECRVYRTVALPAGADGRDSHVVIGEVVGIHLDDALIEDGRIDERRLAPLARLGYLNYATLGRILALARPD